MTEPTVSYSLDNYKASRLYQYYRKAFLDAYALSYRTGLLAIRAGDSLMNMAGGFFSLLYSKGFGRLSGFFRNFDDLSASRAFRGELSLTRTFLRVTRNTGKVFALSAGAFRREGAAQAFRLFARLTAAAACRFWAKNRRAFNYAAPVVGAVALFLTIHFWSNAAFEIAVTYNGQQIGMVQNESAYRNALYALETRVTDASGTDFRLDKPVSFKLVLAKKSDLTSDDTLYDHILMASGSDVEKGYGLYVDNRLVGVSQNGAGVQQMLDSILAGYKSGDSSEQVGFVQNVAVKNGDFPASTEKSMSDMKKLLTANVQDQQDYTAQPGDSPFKVAQQFHLSLDQLYAMNPALASGNLYQGQTVVVESARPYLTVKAVRNEVYTQQIPFSVNKVSSGQLYQGQTQVSVQGRNGSQQVVAAVTYVNGVATNSQVLSTAVISQPVDQQVLVGTKAKAATLKINSAGSAAGSNIPLSAAGSSSVQQMLSYALRFQGIPYVSGGATPSGFDCSGFTQYVYNAIGVHLAHSAAVQAGEGSSVSRSSLQPGDLVFFDTDGGHNYINHVGIYMGGGSFVQAIYGGVTVSNLNDSYYASRYMTAARVVH